MARRAVLCLGFSQLISFGVTYYSIGSFGELIGAELGWSKSLVYGGFSLALLMMGLTSPIAGRLIDRHGGRVVMAAGSVLSAAGCAILSQAEALPTYYAGWACIGLAMRITLYDAAFATLARLEGAGARRSMSLITLFGGLASTTFWPVGGFLADHLGWRGALLAYAGFALLTLPLHLAVPHTSSRMGKVEPRETATLAFPPRILVLAASLFGLIVTITMLLTSGLSAHLIPILLGLGVEGSAAVYVAALFGLGQTLARLCEVSSGARLHPLDLNLLAMGLLPVGLGAGLLSGEHLTAALIFVFVYGAANGIAWITRGTLPLVLFDSRIYGTVVGKLLVPGFLLSALAPFAYAQIIARFGEAAALHVSIVLGLVAAAAALTLRNLCSKLRKCS